MSTQGANPDSWKHKPMPEQREQIPYVDGFCEEEMECIRGGYIPEVMEEKWFIYMEGDWLYLHRSWTGYCYYMVRFEQTRDCYNVAEAWVNRNEEQKRRANPEDEVHALTMVIHLLLLGEYIPIPRSD